MHKCVSVRTVKKSTVVILGVALYCWPDVFNQELRTLSIWNSALCQILFCRLDWDSQPKIKRLFLSFTSLEKDGFPAGVNDMSANLQTLY